MPMVFLSLASACGGAPVPDADTVYRAIQVHEATIAHGAAEAARCPADEACPAADRVCEASEALCAEAETLEDDRDAATRCAMGRERCAGVRR